MKREAKQLLSKAIDSLVLSIEHFNRPSNLGRDTTVLILLDHAFEMLLKGAILHKGGKIRSNESTDSYTIGFDKSVRIGLTGERKFLEENEAFSLQILNKLRDAAQHHLISVSEDQLYLHAQTAVTLFKDLLLRVFAIKLSDRIPDRVLPISVRPPSEMTMLFEKEIESIKELLGPRSRRKSEALSRLKSIAIIDGAVSGKSTIPTQHELQKKAAELRGNRKLEEVFPGFGSMQFTSNGFGPSLDLRITKKEGVPVVVVPEGTPGAPVISIRRVNELSYYSLGRDDIANKLGESGPKTTAIIKYLSIQDDPDSFKEVTVGKVRFKRYSEKALKTIQEALKKESANSIWVKVYPKNSKRP